MPILRNLANVSTADKFSYRRNETAIHKPEKYFLFTINPYSYMQTITNTSFYATRYLFTIMRRHLFANIGLCIAMACSIASTHAQPATFVPRGIGGGGALFNPSINPQDSSEYYVACDMSQTFHTVNSGNYYSLIPFTELFSSPATRIQFSNDPNIRYTLHNDPDNSLNSPVKSTDAGNTWSPLSNDPTSGDAYYLFANPNSSTQLVISDYNSLYFSNDGGNTFSLKYSTAEPNGLHIGGAYWHNSDIYIGSSVGLLVSNNGGNSFALATNTGLPSGNTIYGFAGATSNGTTRLFALTAVDNDIWAGIHPNDYWGHANGIYSLDIGNVAWQARWGSINFANEFPIYIGMAHNDINTVYIAGGSNGAGPYCKKTTDSGNSWNNTFITANNNNIATGNAGQGGHNNWGWVESFFGLDVAHNNSSIAIVSDWGYIHRTENGGNTWQQKYVDYADQHAPNTLINLSDTYKSIGLENTTAWQVAWIDSSNLWACFSDISGIRSTDAGNKWSYDYSGHSENTSYRIAKNIANNTLYMATASIHDLYQSTRLADSPLDNAGNTGSVKYSTNNGSTWQTLHDFSDIVCWVATDPNNSNRLYASVVNSNPSIGGIWVSNNINLGSSSTWTKLPNPPRTEGHPFNIIVLNNGNVLLSYSGHRDPAFTASSGVFLYNTTTQTWSDRSDAGMYYWTKDIIVDNNDTTQNTWYACVYSGWGGAPNGLGGLYRTTNAGTSWTRIWNSDRVGSCTINPNNANELYVTTEIAGLWHTANLNAATPTFTLVNSYHFRQPERLFFNPFNPAEIWVTSFGNGLKMAGTCTPPTPVISGNNTVCANTLHTYSVPAISNSTYNWIITGGTIMSGQGTAQISVLWDNNTIGTINITQTIE